jgi:hypothetical protein
VKRAAPSRWRRRGSDEAGDTLVEILATVTILGIAMVAILAGIGTALRLSTSHRASANAGVVLGIGAEAIKAAAPVTCSALGISSYGTALSAPSPAIALPAGWANSNLSIIGATCDNATALKLQTITIKATAPCPSACESETIDVIKRSL